MLHLAINEGKTSHEKQNMKAEASPVEAFRLSSFEMKRKKPGDIILILIYITLFTLSLVFYPGKGDTLLVETETGSYAYALSEDGVHSFTGPLGITEIEIKDGKARVISSPCRNKICIESGWAETLCCLPNRVTAITTGNEGEVDAISG